MAAASVAMTVAYALMAVAAHPLCILEEPGSSLWWIYERNCLLLCASCWALGMACLWLILRG